MYPRTYENKQETKISGKVCPAPDEIKHDSLSLQPDLMDERKLEWQNYINGSGNGHGEKAILAGLELTADVNAAGRNEAERSLDELEELARTAGLIVLKKVIQKRPARDAACYIGRGKVEELASMLQELGAETLVFDDELSGAQIRNIEEITGAKVLDRTMLILDIFAQRARSKEGKLQVELAQLKYRLPRLTGMGGRLSRLGGGIGTRGPGERKLETDRRHIRRRITTLEKELRNIAKRRKLTRENRQRNEIPVVALVGYTNSGKTTLMNVLCNTDLFAEDKLFATLDTTTRRLLLPDGKQVLLVDTVGFIRKLPHELVEAFKSTLEEAVTADLLLHVVDTSDEEAAEHMKVTIDLLHSLGAESKPVITVLNKIDKISSPDVIRSLHNNKYTFEISALNGTGIEKLLSGIQSIFDTEYKEYRLKIPFGEGWVLPFIHSNGSVIYQEYQEEGIYIKAKLNKAMIEKVREYIIS